MTRTESPCAGMVGNKSNDRRDSPCKAGSDRQWDRVNKHAPSPASVRWSRTERGRKLGPDRGWTVGVTEDEYELTPWLTPAP